MASMSADDDERDMPAEEEEEELCSCKIAAMFVCKKISVC
jgi:hypothetical protein